MTVRLLTANCGWEPRLSGRVTLSRMLMLLLEKEMLDGKTLDWR